MDRVEAIFRNEDEAESVKADVRTLEVENIYVEEMPDDSDGLREFMKKLVNPNEGERHSPYLLRFDVAQEDYARAKAIVEEKEGHFIKENT